MDERAERDPALDQAIEMFKENEEITIPRIMRKCGISYNHAYKILEQMMDMGYPVSDTRRYDAACAEFLNGLIAKICGRDEVKCSFQVKAPARKYSREEIKKVLAEAPQKREDLTISLGEYSAFGVGIRVYIDYGKDIAYKRVSSHTEDSYYLLSMDIPEFVRRLKAIVSSWEHEMVDERILDGLVYHVTFYKNGEKETEYRGQNKFPENYREFRALLRSLSDDSGT